MIIRILLFPFAILYNLISGLRNRLYDRGFKPVAEFDIPVINVGNLMVGGTGKSPMIEHMVRLLQQRFGVATLSRGYGRKTKGFRIAGADDTAATIGDEPFQFYKKFKDKITVAVGEDRAFAIPNILQERSETEVILLDDAFQHRRVRPSLNILLSDYHRPFYNDYLLPAGRLRESRNGASRADIVVVTKCPAVVSDDEMMEIEKSIRHYSIKPVFFSKIHYGNPIGFGSRADATLHDVLLITGIANAKPLKDYMMLTFRVFEHIEYNDHHTYSLSDLHRIKLLVDERQGACIVTTEKDMVKLVDKVFSELLATLPIFYIPIEVEFLKSGEDFDAMVLNSISRGA